MDNNFFSLNNASDWMNGQFSNVEVENDKLQISSSKRYIFEKTIQLDSFGINKINKACCAGENGSLFFLDNDFMLRMYDVYTEMTELIYDKPYKNVDTKLFYSNKKIYVLYQDISYKIDVIAVETGILEDCIATLEDKPFMCIGFSVDILDNLYIFTSEGSLYCINKRLNIQDKFELNRLLDRAYTNYIESLVILRGYNNRHIYLYDKPSKQFIYIDLFAKKVNSLRADNISSIGIYKDLVIVNREENIKSTVYAYDSNSNVFEKLPFLAGKSNNIDFDRHGKIYVYNYENDILTIMSEKKGIRYSAQRNAYKGIYYTRILDSNKQGTLWDKLIVESIVPDDCMLSISYYAYDEHEVYYKDKVYSFSQFITDASIDIEDKEIIMQNRWRGNIVNFSKALFREAHGRYLLLKIELWGNNILTPALSKMRVYYDRQSYTKYLPEIYSSDDNDSFLDRYLAICDSFLQDIEEKIDFISNNFDADLASSEMLRWLCKWMNIEVDLTWSDDKIRRLIKRSPYIFNRRGTKEAIEEILEIYLGVKPIIVENFQLDLIRQNVEMVDLINSLYSNNPYSFTILAKMSRELREEEKTTIKKILDNEAPAYCTYKFIVLEPWMALDKHTYLGINSQILDWSNLRLDGKSILPYNAILTNKQVFNK